VRLKTDLRACALTPANERHSSAWRIASSAPHRVSRTSFSSLPIVITRNRAKWVTTRRYSRRSSNLSSYLHLFFFFFFSRRSNVRLYQNMISRSLSSGMSWLSISSKRQIFLGICPISINQDWLQSIAFDDIAVDWCQSWWIPQFYRSLSPAGRSAKPLKSHWCGLLQRISPKTIEDHVVWSRRWRSLTGNDHPLGWDDRLTQRRSAEAGWSIDVDLDCTRPAR